MAVTIYPSTTQLDQILSEFGVDGRADDDMDGSEDSGMVTACREQGSVWVNRYLFRRRYTVAVIAASTWATWAAAYKAAVLLCKRRGNPVPESLQEEHDAYKEALERIAAGQELLPADDGLAVPGIDTRPVVSNMTVDGRFGRSKLRRMPTISTGPAAADGQKRNDEPYPYDW